MHLLAGWMIGMLLAGAIALAVILALTPSVIRRRFYEPFVRFHQALAILYVYYTWRYLPSEYLLPRLYLYIPLVVGSVSLYTHLIRLVYANGISPPRLSNAVVTCNPSAWDTPRSHAGTPLTIRITLPKPLKVDAGQYVSLWLPTASLLSWSQTHPFMVTSWSPERQEVLELLV
ncbi:uncharacterized protein N7483_004680 [Penicillium malachiteum]|uniref:uncharacterized protein n=1 Tax=Penicillium malachiteum TaxID=1324776 RepID=UPI002546A77E|nr:uncharacterized protein N7483_004680 [Penicillium malachiteum]KAJ5730172.1 hypothetical protein N7483_004680 [Penicillium malachiteum]